MSDLVFRFIYIMTTVIVLTSAISPVAKGGLTDEHSWVVRSQDGQYQLAMLQLEPERFDTKDIEGIELKKKYSRSGVYEGDQFRWAIPYQPPVYWVYISPDGDHVLLAVTDTDHTCSNIPPGAALYFYHKNKARDYWPDHEISWGYGLKMLIYKCMMQYPWLEWEATAYDPVTGTFAVATNQGEEFVFDIRTGKKIRTGSAWNVGVAVFLLLVPLLIYGSGHVGLLKSNADWRPKIRQVSTSEMLLAATVASVLLVLLKYSTIFFVAIAVIGAIGGSVAQFRSRGRRSFWMGAILAVYGTVVGLLVFAVLCEPLLWRVTWFSSTAAVILMLAGCAVVGMVVGALIGGAIAGKHGRCDA